MTKSKALRQVIGAISVGLWCVPSVGNTATLGLLNHLCQSSNPPDQWVCLGYIAGMIDAFDEIGGTSPGLKDSAGGPMDIVTCMTRREVGTENLIGLRDSRLFMDIRNNLRKGVDELKGGGAQDWIGASGSVLILLSKQCASLTETYRPQPTKK